MKIIIIKADDVTSITEKWDRFFRLSGEKGVKVSAGIICNTFENHGQDYIDWLKQHQASGSVEFWNHGWDHRRWTTDDKQELSEFGGSGYTHQKTHYEDAKKIMTQVFGMAPVAFGTPYNAIDADTVKVMNEDDDLRLFFSHKFEWQTNKVLAPMVFNGEGDGTGKPNFAKFKESYALYLNSSFSALQFHPNSFTDDHFAEYARILDFLIAEGWTFLLPAEYVALVESESR